MIKAIRRVRKDAESAHSRRKNRSTKAHGGDRSEEAAMRLKVSEDTLYTWKSKQKKRSAHAEKELSTKGSEGLVEEIESLRKALKEHEAEIELLTGVIDFSQKRRRQK